ncbi:hypothetical protein [Acidocella facilis]|uniref:hypothetical protein n=1 Tax=Acidocella facilis TaxID=525 RepID=UPI001F26073C|nr:hypothetical protein [Acidocella facilis]
MNFPPPDNKVVAAAREKQEAAAARVAATQAAISEVEASLASHRRARRAALDAAVRGEAANADALTAAENGITASETLLTQQREILTRQVRISSAAADELRASHGLAHRPRVVAAIAEMHRAGLAAHAARAALQDAEAAGAAARRVIVEAFGAGFPIPPDIRAGREMVAGPDGLPIATDAAALIRIWGELAGEAGVTPADQPRSYRPGRFKFDRDFTIAGAGHSGGLLEFRAGQPVHLDAPTQEKIERAGFILPPPLPDPVR